jgi:hypothetical protein
VLGGGWTSAPAFSAGSEPTSPPVDPGPRLSRFVSPSSFAPRSVHPHFLCGRRVQRMAGRSIFVGRRRHASAGAWDPARCWGSWSSEASPLSAHAGNLRHAYGFGLARRPFAA